MPKIRLNKAVKELNISIPRAVEYLQSKGIAVDSNPNALLEEQAFSALEAEFRKDGEQRKASHEVVISKVPDEKLAIEEKAPEVIRAKANLKPETKVLGKIDLNHTKSAEEVVSVVPAPEPVQPKEEPKPEVVKTPEKQEKSLPHHRTLCAPLLLHLHSENSLLRQHRPCAIKKYAAPAPLVTRFATLKEPH